LPTNIDLPLVSVVIPAYNRGYALHETIEAVINQTYKNFEIIIVDDGSTDNTKNVVSAFGNKLRYIQKAHSGQGDTRNVGLQYARGEIIAPLDSDDTWHKDFLEKSVGYMLDHQLDMFFSNYTHYISPQNKVIALAHFSKSRNVSNDGCYVFKYDDFRKTLLKDPSSPSSSLIIKKTYIAFGWNPKIHIGDDSFLQFEMIFKNPNCRVGFTNEVLWQKNVDDSNICDGRKGAAFRKLHIQDLQLTLSTFKSYLNDSERKIFDIKILQNKILVVYYSLLERNIGKEITQICMELISKPKLLVIALKTGIWKVVSRKIQQI
jgi:glycosyltransferase involved in cell wall biosynthesis